MVALLASATADATEVSVVGLFPNKAVVQIDGGALRTLSVGQRTAEGIVLVAVGRDGATLDIDGQRTTLGLGNARIARTAPVAESARLTADLQGHFAADGQVNGRSIRFVVDTGATLVALPADDARRVAIDYRNGKQVTMRTANGNAPAYLVKLDTVSVGSVTLHGVDALVIEGKGLPYPLLGMSFLNRMDMKREGDMMTLTRRY
ncbi:MAG: TIGR02281 family clan AA aspartic protease [Burkholderiales bacterium]|nr:TIGR02281 family clan AA aspartic protease [Burkholderiales bacterium]